LDDQPTTLIHDLRLLDMRYAWFSRLAWDEAREDRGTPRRSSRRSGSEDWDDMFNEAGAPRRDIDDLMRDG